MFFATIEWTYISFIVLIIGATHATNNTYNTNNTDDEEHACNETRLKCAFRSGCGTALNNYLQFCAADLSRNATTCPEACQHALIGLASTEEGKKLMECKCKVGDTMCEKPKQQAEICRSSVTAAMSKPRLSCRVASSICNADVLCSTALFYYNQNCKSMFKGKKCSHRCLNSIEILARQEKAEKLNTCVCDGNEDYNCKSIHRNMNVLCFGKKKQPNRNKPTPTNPKNQDKPIIDKKVYSSGNKIFNLPMELLFGVVLISLLLKD